MSNVIPLRMRFKLLSSRGRVFRTAFAGHLYLVSRDATGTWVAHRRTPFNPFDREGYRQYVVKHGLHIGFGKTREAAVRASKHIPHEELPLHLQLRRK